MTCLYTEHVSSDIVTPLSISDVASSSCELRLKLQTSPRDDGVLFISRCLFAIGDEKRFRRDGKGFDGIGVGGYGHRIVNRRRWIGLWNLELILHEENLIGRATNEMGNSHQRNQ